MFAVARETEFDEESSRSSRAACYTTTNEITAETTVYHYTNAEGAAAIARRGVIRASGPAGAFGPGVYATSKSPTHYSQSHILENNYGGGAFGASRSAHAEYVVPAKVPKRGPNAPKTVSGPGVGPRDIKIISEKNHKLSTTDIARIQPFEEYLQNAWKYGAQDTILEVGQAGVTGAVIGGTVSGAYALADWNGGKIDAKEASKRVAKGAGNWMCRWRRSQTLGCWMPSSCKDIGF